MTAYDELAGRAREVLLPTYGMPPLAITRGAGCTVWDTEGRAYTDFVAGIAVCVVGHAHPRVAAAVADQLATLGHVSNLYLTEPAVALAERLAGLAGGDAKVFFANSGAEANEAALKLARARGRRIDPNKTGIVASEGGFHGRTFGALSVTGQPAKRAPFEPLLPGVTFVPYGDAAALARAVTPSTAAVILEPIQGETGVIPAPPGYLAAARAACDAAGALLILDEVQTGLGRTGDWFAWQHDGVRPDVMTLAKGLAGGLPIGACVAFGAATDGFQPGEHASTFGGNPVACRAALEVLAIVDELDLVRRATALGAYLAAAVREAAPALVTTVRGRGLHRAAVLAAPVAKAVETALRERGYLVNAIGDDVVRMVPPLVVTEAEIDGLAAAFAAVAAITGIAATPVAAG